MQQRVLSLAKNKGLDFTQYKEASLLRRLGSRLRKFNISSFDAYIEILDEDPKEYSELILIYFNKQLQEEVLLKFYDALNPGGFLILGMVESLVGASLNAFENIDNRLRIYRKPEDKALQFEKAQILPQADIDRIVNDMLKG